MNIDKKSQKIVEDAFTDEYELLNTIGAGVYGKVFKARSKVTG